MNSLYRAFVYLNPILDVRTKANCVKIFSPSSDLQNAHYFNLAKHQKLPKKYNLSWPWLVHQFFTSFKELSYDWTSQLCLFCLQRSLNLFSLFLRTFCCKSPTLLLAKNICCCCILYVYFIACFHSPHPSSATLSDQKLFSLVRPSAQWLFTSQQPVFSSRRRSKNKTLIKCKFGIRKKTQRRKFCFAFTAKLPMKS